MKGFETLLTIPYDIPKFSCEDLRLLIDVVLTCHWLFNQSFIQEFYYFQAFNKGKTFKGRALKVSWYRPPLTPTSPATAVPTTPTTPTVLKKVEEELGLDIDAELVRTL